MTLEEQKRQDYEDIRAIFQTREGARFFAMLINDVCGVFNFVAPDSEPYSTAYLEGGRNVGLFMLAALERVDDNARVRLAEADRERKVTE